MIRGTFAWGALIAAMSAAAAVAQVAGFTGTVSGFAGPQSNGVTGQPYSAQEETETVQTLADGTHIANGPRKVMHYRDSLGRTRTERTPAPPPGVLAASGSAAPPVFIEIADPVGGYRYTFDSNSHTAHRSPIGQGRAGRVPADPPAGGAVAPVSAQRPRPEISNERLGTKTIEGVLVDGMRITTTYPVGFLGNDRPLTTVTERWLSRELGMTVLTKTSDPRRGESTMKLTNISRAEPDAALFQPPAGYEIVDPLVQPADK